METQPISGRPFSLSALHGGALGHVLTRLINPLLERALGFSELNRIHAACAAKVRNAAATPFSEAALAVLGIRIIPDSDVSRIPATGPLMIVANHPFGLVEGIALSSQIARVRSDAKLLSNHWLERVPELRQRSIFVDVFGGPDAVRRNFKPMREAVEWLRAGGALIAFPAGEVAHFKVRAGRVVEPPWDHHLARMARRTNAAIIPVFFQGCNSFWFHLLGILHPRLRTALLPREFLNKRGTVLEMRVGSAIRGQRLQRFASDRDAAEYLRLRTLVLQSSANRTPRHAQVAADERQMSMRQAIVGSGPRAAIQEEIQSLPAESLLVQGGDCQVFGAYAAHMPNIMREIGRLREITFREVGEGSGKELDLDSFDDHYFHIFAWDQRLLRIAGAYRLGYTSDILSCYGVAGLYTNTLFRYHSRLIKQLGHAVELGRSFITPEYQKSYSMLLLLWKGIARAVSLRPQHRTLFGVVSVSAEYDSMTRRLLMSFLKLNNFDTELAKLVRPRNPVRGGALGVDVDAAPSRIVQDIDEVDELVREIEAGRRGVPVLLRQYLRLNAKVLGFNIDLAFGNVLDALIMVDLAGVDRPILDRFFGRKEAHTFLGHIMSTAHEGSTV